MKWFEGSIADAVSVSRSRNAVFVVYIEGPDEMSSNMSKAMDSGGISSELASSRFICIKLEKDSESHIQFTEIYKIVPVPSLFFIGENGVPLEIVASDNSIQNVTKKIISAISKIKGEPVEIPECKATTSEEIKPNKSGESGSGPPEPSPPALTTSFAEAEASAVPQAEAVATTPSVTSSSDQDMFSEMERVQELIKKNREDKEKLEAEKEKEREMGRRKMGKEISQAKKSHQEKELEDMKKEWEKEKRLDAEARQRVLRQIEDDKANRAARMAAQQPEHPKLSEEPVPTVQRIQPNEARIQFKLPDGQSRTQTFPVNTTLRDLRTFIDSNIKIPFHEYTLATTFPRREFSSRDLNRDLADLELLPSSVLLILPIQGNTSVMRGGGWTTAFTSMLWSLIQPLLNFGSYLTSFVTGRRDDRPPTSSLGSVASTSTSASASSAEQDQAQQPTRPPYYAQLGGGRSVRKRGNVHTLSDGNDDSNDENNTWNGNSTQLM